MIFSQPYMYVVAGFHQGDMVLPYNFQSSKLLSTIPSSSPPPLQHTLRQAIFLPNVEKYFPVYVNLLKLAASGFFMPSGITWVDFVIAGFIIFTHSPIFASSKNI
jgi:hypothetical protein